MGLMEKLLTFLVWALNKWQNRESLKLGGARRSSEWSRVRAEHLKREPVCAICKKSDNLSVHHKLPFSRYPDLELSPLNFITLCEAPGREHHLNYGHLGSYLSYNPEVEKDCEIWRNKIVNRP